MAAPEYVPIKPTDDPRVRYKSPPWRAGQWLADRPGEVVAAASRAATGSAARARTRATCCKLARLLRGQAHPDRRRARRATRSPGASAWR